jgi:hypothetical protein
MYVVVPPYLRVIHFKTYCSCVKPRIIPNVIYRVFTKEWCGFKNLLNDYILQLDGAPPPHFYRNV